jgi:hypothetical protein
LLALVTSSKAFFKISVKDALDHVLFSSIPARRINKFKNRAGSSASRPQASFGGGILSAPQPVASKVEEDADHFDLAAEEEEMEGPTTETVAATTEEDGSSSSPQFSTESPSTPLPGSKTSSF